MFEQIVDIITNSNNIAISFHVSPDGDSLGSSLALMQGIEKLGKNVSIRCNEAIPEDFKFLPRSNSIQNGDIPSDTDCLIILDCGNVERVNCNLINDRNYVLVNIDHHISNDKYGDINYVNDKNSSMGEIVFLLMKELNLDINQEMAICMYTSIMTDTGSFRFSNTTKLTHDVVGELISTGIDFSAIHRSMYENKKYQMVKLSAKVIEDMTLHFLGKVCFMQVDEEMQKSIDYYPEDVSELISVGTQIEGVEVVVFFKCKTDRIKVSLRSKTYFDVRKIAELYGGGGHIKAAGFTYEGELSKLKDELMKKIYEGI
ncbi:bifunctional oligoribonuclease/PAP phosphatase NrnA [Clostridium sp. 19966]|uniref:DHH family phosphoesterase n=1 Tax=Clostridium sp. 19966 TaxID=2768166 RepID=UPI0028DFBE98|nr:bifunctional oligoribonuclease/PAP phosphatase NrnA [Clostridium sp. 19966]MDT8716417.1 bifunctional oligoribonuclease/PAP phosphatase NrnA [Clostridium sp. 19966]